MILTIRGYERLEEMREEGRQEGRQEMREEMLEKGREEKNNIIKRMINKNASIEQIHEFTGYPINEIQQVKDIYIN